MTQGRALLTPGKWEEVRGGFPSHWLVEMFAAGVRGEKGEGGREPEVKRKLNIQVAIA